jgi:hypothetical protein
MSLPESSTRWGRDHQGWLEPAWFSGERLVAIAAGLIWLALVVRVVGW